MSKNTDTLDTVAPGIKPSTPSILKQTAQKYGVARAQKQKSAIMLNKTRKFGAKPQFKSMLKGA